MDNVIVRKHGLNIEHVIANLMVTYVPVQIQNTSAGPLILAIWKKRPRRALQDSGTLDPKNGSVFEADLAQLVRLRIHGPNVNKDFLSHSLGCEARA